jgi:hypothetical protein
VESGEHGVGVVDLVACCGEVLADQTAVDAAGDAVLHEPGRFEPVGVPQGQRPAREASGRPAHRVKGHR